MEKNIQNTSLSEESFSTEEQHFNEFENEQQKHSVVMWSSIALFFGFLFGIASLMFPYFFSDEHSYTMSHSSHDEKHNPHHADITNSEYNTATPEIVIRATYN